MARSQKPIHTATLLYASTDHSADMLYFGGVDVPDAFPAFLFGKTKVAVVNRLEFARVVRESSFDRVIPLEDCIAAASQLTKGKRPDASEVIAVVAGEYKVKHFTVPRDFPVWLAYALKNLGFGVEVSDGMVFPQRELKSDAEAAAIRQGNAASAAGFSEVERILKAAKIVRGRIMHEGKALTSERLREAIDIACLRHGALASHTIVAGGDQACDPHCRGSGLLKPNDLIIVDIFPRVSASGYYGDMTRTYLKGEATEAQRRLVQTVFEAQQAAIPRFKAGAQGRKIYDEVCQYFSQKGYETKTVEGVSIGFFHGLGHGLGLEVHEAPRVSAVEARLKIGQVITVEPGLYYPGLGGCRIEDVVRVCRDGPELLSHHPYKWEVR